MTNNYDITYDQGEKKKNSVNELEGLNYTLEDNEISKIIYCTT